MAYVIIGTCINDAACVAVCPADCIHPAPTDTDFVNADMLFIDPELCLDCNACAEACPVEAVLPAHALPPDLLRYKDINAQYSRERKR